MVYTAAHNHGYVRAGRYCKESFVYSTGHRERALRRGPLHFSTSVSDVEVPQHCYWLIVAESTPFLAVVRYRYAVLVAGYVLYCYPLSTSVDADYHTRLYVLSLYCPGHFVSLSLVYVITLACAIAMSIPYANIFFLSCYCYSATLNKLIVTLNLLNCTLNKLYGAVNVDSVNGKVPL